MESRIPDPMDSEQLLAKTDNEKHVNLRFLISKEIAGRIIGKGGENVKQFREMYGAQIKIPQCQSPERVMVISGSLQTVLDTMTAIVSKYRRPSKEEDKSDDENKCEIKMFVHESSAGAIIGTKGGRIKQLRSENDCQVRCFRICAPGSSERVVRICGQKDSLIRVLKICYALCLSSPPRGPIIPYDPTFYKADMVQDYGGIGSETQQYYQPGPPPSYNPNANYSQQPPNHPYSTGKNYGVPAPNRNYLPQSNNYPPQQHHQQQYGQDYYNNNNINVGYNDRDNASYYNQYQNFNQNQPRYTPTHQPQEYNTSNNDDERQKYSYQNDNPVKYSQHSGYTPYRSNGAYN